MSSPLAIRIRNLFCRGTTILTNSKANLQRLQVRLFGQEVGDGIEFMEHYGYTSHPPAGLDTAIFFVGGSRDNGVCVAVGDRKFRIRGLQEGEVAIYTDEGDFIKLLRGRHMHVSTQHLLADVEKDAVLNCTSLEVNATEKVTVTSEEIELKASKQIRLSTPNLAIGGGKDSSKTTAIFSGNLQQDGWHSSTEDQVAGGVSQMTHPHSCDKCGRTSTPIVGA